MNTLKLSVFNGSDEILEDPIEGRPFSHVPHEIVDHDEAEFILGYTDFLDCNKDYNRIRKSEVFKEHKEKFVFMFMHDTPKCAYIDKEPIKFVAQPLYGEKVNREYNVVPYPLQMRHYELKITSDKEYIYRLRNNPKGLEYIFIGNKKRENRKWLDELDLDNFKIKQGRSIWKLKTLEERIPVLKAFYDELSRSRFAFAPRGSGSSSFRLYQSMMVGTVPIETGMEDYPFSDVVNWDNFCIRGDSIDNMIDRTKQIDYDKMRKNAMRFWDEFVHTPNCDKKLVEFYLLGEKPDPYVI